MFHLHNKKQAPLKFEVCPLSPALTLAHELIIFAYAFAPNATKQSYLLQCIRCFMKQSCVSIAVISKSKLNASHVSTNPTQSSHSNVHPLAHSLPPADPAINRTLTNTHTHPPCSSPARQPADKRTDFDINMFLGTGAYRRHISVRMNVVCLYYVGVLVFAGDNNSADYDQLALQV